jgi:hypothetical protein
VNTTGAGGEPLEIVASKATHQLTDVTVVADAGMISEANQIAIGAARLSFILGTRIPFLPDVRREWRDRHPGDEIPHGRVLTQPWPATSGARGAGSMSRSPRPNAPWTVRQR